MGTGRKRGNSKEKRIRRERERERERERATWTKPMCNCTWAFSSKNDSQFLPSIFSPFWKKKKTFWCAQRKNI